MMWAKILLKEMTNSIKTPAALWAMTAKVTISAWKQNETESFENRKDDSRTTREKGEISGSFSSAYSRGGHFVKLLLFLWLHLLAFLSLPSLFNYLTHKNRFSLMEGDLASIKQRRVANNTRERWVTIDVRLAWRPFWICWHSFTTNTHFY